MHVVTSNSEYPRSERVHFTVTRKLFLLVVLFLAGLIATFGLAYRTLSVVKVNGPVYRDIVRNKDLVADILPPPEYIIEAYLTVHELANQTDTDTQNRLIEK